MAGVRGWYHLTLWKSAKMDATVIKNEDQRAQFQKSAADKNKDP